MLFNQVKTLLMTSLNIVANNSVTFLSLASKPQESPGREEAGDIRFSASAELHCTERWGVEGDTVSEAQGSLHGGAVYVLPRLHVSSLMHALGGNGNTVLSGRCKWIRLSSEGAIRML